MATAELEVETRVETPAAQVIQAPAKLDWVEMSPADRQAEADKIAASVIEPPSKTEVPSKTTPETPKTSETPAHGDETPAKGDAVETEKVEGEGELAGIESKPADWRDEETREFATMMGLSETDLSEFGSREELDRTLRIINRKAFEAGKAGLDSSNQQSVQEQQVQQRVQPAEPKKSVLQQQQQAEDPFAQVSAFQLDEQLGAEDAPKISKGFQDVAAALNQLQVRIARFEREAVQESVADIERRAIDSLHRLGMTDLFGKPGEQSTKEQAENVRRAVRAHFIHARGLLADGRQVSPTPAFLKAAVHLEFGDQLLKNQQRQLIQKVQKQSARRTGGPAVKPAEKPLGDWDTLSPSQKKAEADRLAGEVLTGTAG